MEDNDTLTKAKQIIKRFLGTNLSWFLFNIPIVMFSYDIFNNYIEDSYLMMLLIIVCLGPLVFFPATSAMFAVLRKFIMGQDVSIMRSYLNYYKENYLSSFSGGILISILWFLLAYAYFSWADISPLLNLLFLILAVFLFVFMSNFISTIVHMEVKLFAAYKNAFIITIGAPLLTIVMGAISAALIYVSVNMIPILVPLLTGSVIAHISFSGYYKMMINIQQLTKITEESEENVEEES